MLKKIKDWLGSGAISDVAAEELWIKPFNEATTKDDIFHCFRLILGRNPNREEWPGHFGRVGENLEIVVKSYLRSLEFSNRKILTNGMSSHLSIVDLPGFYLYVSIDDLDVGQHVRNGVYETDVTCIFRKYLKSNMAVIDIGANIGYFTCLSASIVGPGGHVMAIEPNPQNVRMMEASRRLNDFTQVTIVQVAAGRETGLLALHAAQSNGTTSSPHGDIDVLLASQTVPCLAVDSIVSQTRRIDLIKMDIEGAEYNAFQGILGIIARDKPIIISEFSPDMMPSISGVSGPEYLDCIIAQNYEIGVIQSDGSVSEMTPSSKTVMDAYFSRGRDHINILALPIK